MLSFVSQLLLTTQAFGQEPSLSAPGQGQQPGWPNRDAAIGLVQQRSMYLMTGQPSTYTQPGGYQQQSPAAWSTYYAYNPEPAQPAALAYNSQPMGYQPAQVQPYQPPSQPLPSREVIEQQKEAFVRETNANLQAELQKLEEETAKAKHSFVTEQENTKRQYLASYFQKLEEETAKAKHSFVTKQENEQSQYFQNLDQDLVTRKQDATTVATDYAARVEEQAKELIKNTAMHSLQAEHERKQDVLAEEEMSNKQELEQQIRAAYDARRYGASFSDPVPAVEVARRRFDEQMHVVAQKRNALLGEFQQSLANMRVN